MTGAPFGILPQGWSRRKPGPTAVGNATALYIWSSFDGNGPRLTAAVNLHVDFNWVDHGVLRL
jgi:hypothetical protein